MKVPVLQALRWSPPSERARWVFRARGVPFRELHHVPSSHHAIRLKWATGQASVPVLFADGRAIAGSTVIARWADARGTRGDPFFPAGADAEIDAWDAIADDLFRTSRDLFGPAFARDRDALRATIDPAPFWARAVFPLVWRFAGSSFGRRYDVGSSAEASAHLREALVRAEMRRAGRTHLVGGRLTYADVAVATYLCGVRPPPADLLPLPGSIAQHFATVPEPGPWDSLFAWRDEIWRAHHLRD